MAYKNLERFLAVKAEEKKTEIEEEARRTLKRVVKSVIPKNILAPKRPRGKTPVGGVTRKEVKALRERVETYMEGATGLAKAEAEMRRTALVILLIDGVLGTEPWRAAGGPHGALVSANARLRYLENAARLLDDMRRGSGSEPRLLEGVIDVEPIEKEEV